jgi:quinol monooxygenase YgiN
MLVIAGTIHIDPDKRDAAIAAATEMMERTRQESGCVAYVFSADLSDPGAFHLFEQWESQAALDAHFDAPHMAKFQGQIGGLGLRDMKVQRYEISSVGPLGG